METQNSMHSVSLWSPFSDLKLLEQGMKGGNRSGMLDGTGCHFQHFIFLFRKVIILLGI